MIIIIDVDIFRSRGHFKRQSFLLNHYFLHFSNRERRWILFPHQSQLVAGPLVPEMKSPRHQKNLGSPPSGLLVAKGREGAEVTGRLTMGDFRITCYAAPAQEEQRLQCKESKPKSVLTLKEEVKFYVCRAMLAFPCMIKVILGDVSQFSSQQQEKSQ